MNPTAPWPGPGGERGRGRLRLAVALATLLAPGAAAQTAADLRVGHWLEVRGEASDERFRAQRLEVAEPEDDEVLIGTVPFESVYADGFTLLGQPVVVDDGTQWEDVRLATVGGRRVEVEGHWRGPGKFSAGEIQPYGEGRDRIVGRVDAIRPVEGGLELSVMRWRVFVPEGTEVRCEGELASIRLAPERDVTAPEYVRRTRDEDDLFGAGIRLTDTLSLTGQLEWRTTFEDDYNLDERDDEDRHDDAVNVRPRLIWSPSDRVYLQAELKYGYRWRNDEDKAFEHRGDLDLGETFVYVKDLPFDRWDLQVGRQDFDDEREWIYDADLDAVRLFWNGDEVPTLELSASTLLSEGDHRDRNARNLGVYLSNGDDDRHLALWALHRDFDLEVDERALWVGGRALGDFVPQNESWLDVAALRAERGDTDVRGWAYDVGTTWVPDAWDERLSLTLGYAYASGDDDPDDGTDGTFRQTGLQDNNGKFAGVTSFRYYGELVDPELANLGVFTAGVGFALAERTSLDLVYHRYTQDRVRPEILDSDLDLEPAGLDGDLGYEVDAILGSRELASWDLEVVGAWFRPGEAFEDADDAFLIKVQLRYRF